MTLIWFWFPVFISHKVALYADDRLLSSFQANELKRQNVWTSIHNLLCLEKSHCEVRVWHLVVLCLLSRTLIKPSNIKEFKRRKIFTQKTRRLCSLLLLLSFLWTLLPLWVQLEAISSHRHCIVSLFSAWTDQFYCRLTNQAVPTVSHLHHLLQVFPEGQNKFSLLLKKWNVDMKQADVVFKMNK